MAVIWADAGTAEGNDTKKAASVTTSGTGTVTSDAQAIDGSVRSWKYDMGANAASTAYHASRTWTGTNTGGWQRKMRYSNYPVNGAEIVRFKDGSGNNAFAFFGDGAGGIKLINAGYSAQIGATTPAVGLNTDFTITVRWNITNGTTWTLRVWQNHSLVVNVTGGTTIGTSITGFLEGNISGGAASDAFFAAHGYAVDSYDAGVDMPEWYATAKRPFANGSSNGFTTGVGSDPGSPYGSGHAPRVNERPINASNGYELNTSSVVTEEYTGEDAATGDKNISGGGFTVQEVLGWLWAKAAGGTRTCQLVLDGTDHAISVGTSAAWYEAFKGSGGYPAGSGTDIGMKSQAVSDTYTLYECGEVILYSLTTVVALSGTVTANVHDADFAGGLTAIFDVTNDTVVSDTPVAPTLRGVGAFGSGTTGFTAAVPTGGNAPQAGDAMYIIMESTDSTTAAGTPDTPGGGATWQKLFENTISPGVSGQVSTLTVFGKIAGAGEGDVSITGVGNHCAGAMIVVANHGLAAITDTVVGAATDHGTGTTNILAPSINVTANSFIITCMGLSDDAADTSNVSGVTNANLAGIAERIDQTVSTGAGGGVGIYTATCAGTSTGTTEWDHDTAVASQSMQLGIPPAATPFAAARQAMLNGADQSAGTEFETFVQALALTSVVRTDNDTITVTMTGSLSVAAQRTVTWTVPGSMLTKGVAVVATPTFTIDPSATTETRTVTPVAANLLRTLTRTVTPARANNLKTNTRTVTPARANLILTNTRTVTTVRANNLKVNTRTVTPVAANVLKVNTRTVSTVRANLNPIVRTVTPVRANVAATSVRTISTVKANLLQAAARTVTPVRANLLQTNTRTVSTVRANLNPMVRTVTPVAANLARTLSRTVTPAAANILKTATRTLTPIAANVLRTLARSVTPVLANLTLVNTRTATPVAANLVLAHTRSITPVAANLLATNVRAIAPVKANLVQTFTRTITPVRANLIATSTETRTVTPVAANILKTNTRTATTVRANLLLPGTARSVSPVLVNVLQTNARGVPAFSFDTGFDYGFEIGAGNRANVLKVTTRTITAVAANLSLAHVRTVTPVAANLLLVNTRTITPVAANLARTLARTVSPVAANLNPMARTVSPVAANILVTTTRTVTPVRANLVSGTTMSRIITSVTANILVTTTRTVTPVAANLLKIATRTVAPVAANLALLNTRTVAPVRANLVLTHTRTITTVRANLLATNARTVSPVAANLLATNARTVTPVLANLAAGARTVTPVAANLLATNARTVTPVAANISRTNSRTVALVAANLRRTVTRTITPVRSNLLLVTTETRTVTPVRANLLRTQARTVGARVNLVSARILIPSLGCVLWEMMGPYAWPPSGYLAQFGVLALPSDYIAVAVPMVASGYIAVESPVAASGYIATESTTAPSGFIAPDDAPPPPSGFIWPSQDPRV